MKLWFASVICHGAQVENCHRKLHTIFKTAQETLYNEKMILCFWWRGRESREDQRRIKSSARQYRYDFFDPTLTRHTMHKSDELGASCGAYLARFSDLTHLNLSYGGFKACAATY